MTRSSTKERSSTDVERRDEGRVEDESFMNEENNKLGSSGGNVKIRRTRWEREHPGCPTLPSLSD